MRSLPHLLFALLLLGSSLWAAAVETLTTVKEVQALTRTEAAQRLPVRLRGVITYFDPSDRHAFLRDDTGGIFFWPGTEFFEVGERVEIEGWTRKGRFSPSVSGAGSGRDTTVKVRRLGKGSLPMSIPMAFDRVATGSYHDQWTISLAVIRGMALERCVGGYYRLNLELSSREGRLAARIPMFPPEQFEEAKKWLNVDVRIRGVVAGGADDAGQLNQVQLLIPSPKYLQSEANITEAVFRQEPRAHNDILSYDPQRPTWGRVHVQGTITAVQRERGLFLMGQGGALWVRTPQKDLPNVGDAISVAGFPTHENKRVFLTDGIVRRAEKRFFPQPARLSAQELSSRDHFASLVSVEGIVRSDVREADLRTLVLENDAHRFLARLGEQGTGAHATLEPGTRVLVTGVMEASRRDRAALDRPAADFYLLSRSGADLQILAVPPWLNPDRLRWLAAGLGGVLTLCILWVTALHRQVRSQTEIIRQKVAQETIVTERQRIARELHDTLEQQLAGVQLQLNALAYQLPNAKAEVRTAICSARAMLEHSRSEARRSVWELRSQLLEEAGLPGAVRSIAMQLGDGGVDAPSIEVETSGMETRMERQVEFHLLRIAQEAITNALKHANAHQIRVRFEFSPDALRMEIKDDGRGFDPAQLGVADRPRFGLLGMRERSGKILARLKVDSAPGAGTTVSVVVPILRPQMSSVRV